jgi:hypothetical protein
VEKNDAQNAYEEYKGPSSHLIDGHRCVEEADIHKLITKINCNSQHYQQKGRMSEAKEACRFLNTNSGSGEITSGREPQVEDLPASQLLGSVYTLGMHSVIILRIRGKMDGSRLVPGSQPRV